MSLKVLVDPGPGRADIDVVAVHGLNPFSKQDHAHRTWTTDGKLWLRDFLPDKEPTARILLHEYNANAILQPATIGFRETADKLLQLLFDEREDDPRRPLIFVCHSLGGIIVKRAIVGAQHDDTHQALLQSIYGLVFFGTPHNGSDLAGFAEFIATVSQSFRAKVSGNTFLEVLKKDSLIADDLNSMFRHHWLKYQILSIYETKPMRPVNKLVVGKSSATIGLPGNQEEICSVPSDHTEMCKFGSEDDPNYQLIERRVRRLCRQAVKARLDRSELEALDGRLAGLRTPLGSSELRINEQQMVEQAREGAREDCLKLVSSSFKNMDERYDNIHSVTDSTSSSWLFQQPEFKIWESCSSTDHTPAFLLVSGNVGTGKSVLMKREITRSEEFARQDNKRLTLSFLFDNNRNESDPNWVSSIGMYRRLLYQAIKSLQPAPIRVLQRIKEDMRGNPERPLTREKLQDYLAEALEQCKALSQTVYVFLDALDEWDPVDRKASKGLLFLQSLVHRGIPLKVCSSSRRYPIFEYCQPAREIVLSVENFSQSGIDEFIQKHMNIPHKIGTEKQLFLESKLLEKANHNFMWLGLVIPDVVNNTQGRDINKLNELINKLPPGLPELYEKILLNSAALDSIERTETYFLFQLIAYAKEPLTPQEVIDAVLLCVYTTSWKNQRTKFEAENGFDFAKYLVTKSHGLIEVIQSRSHDQNTSCVVQFAHVSIRDYIVSDGGIQILDSSASAVTCNFQLLKMCMEFFRQDSIKEPCLRIRQYATSYWMEHASSCNEWLRTEPLNWPHFLRRCNRATPVIVGMYQDNLDRRSAAGIMQDKPSLMLVKDLLVILAAEGCTELIALHLREDSCRKCRSDAISKPSILDSAIHEAVINNRCNTVELLAKQPGCNFNSQHDFSTPLYQACYHGLEEMVHKLLSLGSDPYEASDLDYTFPLNAAVGCQRENVVRILLEHSFDNERLLRQKDRHGHTPLHIAAKFGYKDIVRIILDEDSELVETSVGLEDDQGRTARQLAAINQHSAVVKEFD